MTVTEAITRAALIGAGGTIVLDLWALFMARLLNMPTTNWPMVGRWIGNMRHGQFVQENVAKARPVKGEAAIGWIAHYAIGICYGLLLLAILGRPWLGQPSFFPPMILSWLLLVAPYFVMMPGMGTGVAGSRTPKPSLTRLKSVIGHSIFGLGMYGSALALAKLWS